VNSICEVSNDGSDLMAQLVAWEMLGREDIDPHRLLRNVSERDLDIVRKNLRTSLNGTRTRFLCYELIELELFWRRGLLKGDWKVIRNGDNVKMEFVLLHHTYWDPKQERVTA
jgi:hypothetical protein